MTIVDLTQDKLYISLWEQLCCVFADYNVTPSEARGFIKYLNNDTFWDSLEDEFRIEEQKFKLEEQKGKTN